MKTRAEMRAEIRRKQEEEAAKIAPPPPESSRLDLDDKKQKVKELSEELNKHLTPQVPEVLKFPTANRKHKVRLRPDLDYIVSQIQIVDLKSTYDRLMKGLSVGEKRSDHGTLQHALDNAERNAQDAHRLYVTAKLEAERWEREMDAVHGAMHTQANASLQAEKDTGRRSKQITDMDVKLRAAVLFPDEYQAQETRRAEIKATVDSLEHLTLMWDSRCKSIAGMLAKLRG